MLYNILLGVHIAAGVVGLVVGAFAFRPPRTPGERAMVRRGYQAALIVLVVSVMGAVAAHWSELGTVTRVVFLGLGVLGAVIVAQGQLAMRVLRRQPANWQDTYLNRIYFTYISLWQGFVIVALLNRDVPPWLVAVVAISVLIVGSTLLKRYKRRVLPGPVR